jgi:large subunit ribosomal protein L17
MRHNKKINHLGRTSSHRQAMLSNMASSLIKHKRIFTTIAKAKALRKYVEPLVTKSKKDTTHSRRVVFSLLQDKYAVTELFTVVSEKVITRPGGYTRIIKTGNRLGDNAAMCFIELVDFNENMLKETKKTAAKTRRSRRKSTGGETVAAKEISAAVSTENVKTPVAEVDPVVEDIEATPAEEVSTEAAPAAVSEEAAPTVSEEAAPTVSEEVAPTVSEEAAPVVSEEAAPTVSEEAAPAVSEEAAPTVSEEAAPTVEEVTETPGEEPKAE